MLELLRAGKNSFSKLKHTLVSMTLGIKYVLPKLRNLVQILSTHIRAGHGGT